MGETLDAVAAVRLDPRARCEDLQQQLRRFLDAPGEVPESPEASDDELPFQMRSLRESARGWPPEGHGGRQ